MSTAIVVGAAWLALSIVFGLVLGRALHELGRFDGGGRDQ